MILCAPTTSSHFAFNRSKDTEYCVRVDALIGSGSLCSLCTRQTCVFSTSNSSPTAVIGPNIAGMVASPLTGRKVSSFNLVLVHSLLHLLLLEQHIAGSSTPALLAKHEDFT